MLAHTFAQEIVRALGPAEEEGQGLVFRTKGGRQSNMTESTWRGEADRPGFAMQNSTHLRMETESLQPRLAVLDRMRGQVQLVFNGASQQCVGALLQDKGCVWFECLKT